MAISYKLIVIYQIHNHIIYNLSYYFILSFYKVLLYIDLYQNSQYQFYYCNRPKFAIS
jgi:hypothetical protein